VVAAFGNLEISVVARGQLDALRRHQIQKGVVRTGQMRMVVRTGQMRMHRRQDFLAGVGPRYRQDAGMQVAHQIALRSQATGDDHLAVLG